MTNKEFITAATLSGGGVEWTTLRRRKGACEQVEHRSSPADGTDTARDAAGGHRPASWGGAKGALSLILPSDRALLRVVDLPSSDPAELRGMVELQVDKFAPFPVEQMCISFEILSGDDSSSRVLIAACKQDTVVEWAGHLTDPGRWPDRVDIAVACRWSALRAAEVVPASGRHGILLYEPAGADLLVVQDGVPVIARPLGAPPPQGDDEYVRELAEEIGYTFTSLEAEWGGIAIPEMVLWCAESPPPLLVERLEESTGATVRRRALDELPPLTVTGANRMAGQRPPLLDLALPDWKQAAHARLTRRMTVQLVVSIVLAWLAIMVTLFVVSGVEAGRIERLRAAIDALEGPAEETRLLRRRVESLEQYADRSYSALEVLREVSLLLPDQVELTSFTYRKGGQVNIRGEADRVPPIYDFLEALEQSALFTEVKPEGVTQAPGGRRRPDFRLSARLPGDEP